ncbi:hypothetical protein DFJ73DRAFT_809141 [Zopfochytrium polystomum]|nr:hypothetical protein DFJ73DRAFT_809141 [Zopfochytrium polystomum]
METTAAWWSHLGLRDNDLAATPFLTALAAAAATTNGTGGDPSCPPSDAPVTRLQWYNVVYGFSLVIANVGISSMFSLGLESTMIIAAFRCIVQLSVMGLVLKPVFENEGPLLVFGLAAAMMTISAVEIVYNKSKARYEHMFPLVWLSMAASTILVSFVGNFFAIQAHPWYRPRDYIPVLGMLLGNSMSAVAVGLSSFLTSLSDNKDRVEMYLSFGASRWEAARPAAVEAIRLALLPTLNTMSIIGLISIPGMMTGQILGGASIDDAVRYQLIVMFLITACCSLSVISSVLACFSICFDQNSRLRLDRIIRVQKKKSTMNVERVVGWVKERFASVFRPRGQSGENGGRDAETQPLLRG